MKTVAELVHEFAKLYPDKNALRFEGRNTSYSEMHELVCRSAASLTAEGVREGDRIAYLGKNTDRYFVLLYAASHLGAVMVPVSWRLAPAEIRYIIDNTEATILFVDREFAEIARESKPLLPRVKKVICVDEEDRISQFIEWLGPDTGVYSRAVQDADRVFIQLYTSGTTGKPKGVMLSTRCFNGRRDACAEAGVEWDHWDENEIALVAMTVAHVAGSGYGIMALYHRSTALIIREFSADQMLRLIRDERVSKFFIAPAALQTMVRHPDARSVDYSRIRHILYGSSPIPLTLLRDALDVFRADFVQQYGMTETAGTVVALDALDHDPSGNERMKSTGRAMPGVEVRIIDAENRALPVREVGEIVTRSDSNMIGYWKQPEATASTIDSEGWLHTGDAGYVDEDGYLYICDRLKDMICSGGENVYPAEVEAVLYEHPNVADVAVIGVPDETWGEAVKAIIVPHSRDDFDPFELIGWARTRLAGFKLPKSVDLVDDLPRNATGKVLKKDLRAPYWAGRERQVN